MVVVLSDSLVHLRLGSRLDHDGYALLIVPEGMNKLHGVSTIVEVENSDNPM